MTRFIYKIIYKKEPIQVWWLLSPRICNFKSLLFSWFSVTFFEQSLKILLSSNVSLFLLFMVFYVSLVIIFRIISRNVIFLYSLKLMIGLFVIRRLAYCQRKVYQNLFISRRRGKGKGGKVGRHESGSSPTRSSLQKFALKSTKISDLR